MPAAETMRTALRVSAAAGTLALAAVALSWRAPLPAGTALLAALPLTLLAAWIAIVDARSFTIPDAALVPFALVALAVRIADPIVAFDPGLGLALIAIDGFVAGGAVLLVREVYYRRRGVDGIGFGDVKLAAAGGLLCGLFGFSLALLSASLAGLAVAGILKVRGSGLPARLPFGAFLAPAFWLVWASGL